MDTDNLLITEFTNKLSAFDTPYQVKCVDSGESCLANSIGTVATGELGKGFVTETAEITGLTPNVTYSCYVILTYKGLNRCSKPVTVTTGSPSPLNVQVLTSGISPTSWTGTIILNGARSSSAQTTSSLRCVPRGQSCVVVNPSFPAVDIADGGDTETTEYLEPNTPYSCYAIATTETTVSCSEPVNIITPPVDPQCVGIDASGAPRPVDWFVMLKQPTGYDFVYLDNLMLETCDNPEDCWYYPPTTLTNMETGRTPVAYTLQYAVDAAQNSMGYLYLSDQPPNFDGKENIWFSGDCDSSWAHAKSAAMFSNNTGILLDHSAPNFPVPVKYADAEFPFYWLGVKQACLAQHFACMSFDSETFGDQVSNSLATMKAFVYDTNFPASLRTQYPTLFDITKSFQPDKTYNYTADASTSEGTDLVVVSKPTCFSNVPGCNYGLVHDNYTVPALNETVSWMTFYSVYPNETVSGPQMPLPSACPATPETPDANSKNIIGVSFPGRDDMINQYNYTRDHAKWGVTPPDATGKYACFGDMNRSSNITVAGQKKRGGAFYCLNNEKLWGLMNQAVQSTLDCGLPALIEFTDFSGCDGNSSSYEYQRFDSPDYSYPDTCIRYYSPA